MSVKLGRQSSGHGSGGSHGVIIRIPHRHPDAYDAPAVPSPPRRRDCTDDDPPPSISSSSKSSSSSSSSRSSSRTSFRDLTNAWETMSQASGGSRNDIRGRRRREMHVVHDHRNHRASFVVPSDLARGHAGRLYGRGDSTTASATTASGNGSNSSSSNNTKKKRRGARVQRGDLARQFDGTLGRSRFLRKNMDGKYGSAEGGKGVCCHTGSIANDTLPSNSKGRITKTVDHHPSSVAPKVSSNRGDVRHVEDHHPTSRRRIDDDSKGREGNNKSREITTRGGTTGTRRRRRSNPCEHPGRTSASSGASPTRRAVDKGNAGAMLPPVHSRIMERGPPSGKSGTTTPAVELENFLTDPTGLNWEDLVRSVRKDRKDNAGTTTLLDREILVYDDEDEVSEMDAGARECEGKAGYVGNNEFMGGVVTSYFESKVGDWDSAEYNDGGGDRQSFEPTTGEGWELSSSTFSSISSASSVVKRWGGNYSSRMKEGSSGGDELERMVERVVVAVEDPLLGRTVVGDRVVLEQAEKRISPLSPPPRISNRGRSTMSGGPDGTRRTGSRKGGRTRSIGSGIGSAFSPIEASSSSASSSLMSSPSKRMMSPLSPTTPGTAAMGTSFDTAASPYSRSATVSSTKSSGCFRPIERHSKMGGPTRPNVEPVSPVARRTIVCGGGGKGKTRDVRVVPPRITLAARKNRHERHHRRGESPPVPPMVIMTTSTDEMSSHGPTRGLLKNADTGPDMSLEPMMAVDDPPLMMPASSSEDVDDEDDAFGDPVAANPGNVFGDLVVAALAWPSGRHEKAVVGDDDFFFDSGIDGGKASNDIMAFRNTLVEDGGNGNRGEGAVAVEPFPAHWDDVCDGKGRRGGGTNDGVANENAQSTEVAVNNASDGGRCNVSKSKKLSERRISKKKSGIVYASNASTEKTSTLSTAVLAAPPVLILPQTLSTARRNPTCWQIAVHRMRRTKGEF